MPKPTIPQGTRDFSSDIVRKRNYIFSTIRNVFELYGFEPLETPAMENLETLTGKYGEEGDKLMFKILNNGLSNEKNIEAAKAGFEKILEGKISVAVTERAMKYDLTIPFARYVAMNHTKLTFPFRRYQIQPVWRADRPQKGRYREFTQCDADVVGSTSLMNEVELACIYHDVFTGLKITGYELRINSRKILTALGEICNDAGKVVAITTAIDKLDKIGIEKVKEELKERELNDQQVAKIETYMTMGNLSGNVSNADKIDFLKTFFKDSVSGQKGIEELEFLIQHIPVENNIVIDLTLARGLNYYTGVIFEAKAPSEIKMGSIGGGGRYDDLTGLFDVPGIPGVGISFGVDRIYDVMSELNLFPAEVHIGTKVLFMNMGDNESKFAFGKMQELRKAGISCELYHEFSKIGKQFNYAEKKNIAYVVIIGSKEIEQENCVVKNLSTTQQEIVPFANLTTYFSTNN